MRLFLLTALTMVAFAANSILNRMALAGGGIDPITFGRARLLTGALMLVLLVLITRRNLGFLRRGRMVLVVSLFVYIFGFSVAYVSLDAGVGALILFGTVQVTMMAGAALSGEGLSPRKLTGAGVAFAGLSWMMLPGGTTIVPSTLHAGLMVAAGVGWGVYSLVGRSAGDPLEATAANFLYATPLAFALALVLPVQLEATPVTTQGLILAALSGAVTSGLGYALWYAVLPRIAAAQAAVAQLTVPVIAVAGGVALLGETLSLHLAIASAIVLGGVAWSVTAR